MPQLSTGQNASLVMGPGESYTISAAGTTTVKGIYGAPSTTTTLTSNFQVFGPYLVPAKLDIACVSGTASYSLVGAGVPLTAAYDLLTGGKSLILPDGTLESVGSRQPILLGASAGTDSGWLSLSNAPERFVYQLDSGTTTTTFSVDISADGVTSLGQAFTGTYASSAVAEITFPIMFSNPLAKFFRWNVVSGGPLSVSRGA